MARSEVDQSRQSRQAARELVAAIRGGAQLPQAQSPIRLRQDEYCFAASTVTIWQHTATDAEWQERSGGLFVGGLAGYAAKRAVQAGRNASRKRQAMRDAAAQWRAVEHGNIWLTNQRFAVQGSEWFDMWHENVASLSCDGDAIELHYNGMPPTRLQVPYPDWWYVMMRWVAYHEIVSPPDET